MNSDFKELLKAFEKEKVEYLIIGGYAVAKHAESPRVSKGALHNVLQLLFLTNHRNHPPKCVFNVQGIKVNVLISDRV